MSLSDIAAGVASKLPSVNKPVQRLNFKDKLKWTGLILVLFFLLGAIPIWGVDSSAIAHFEFLEIVFGSSFGSLLTLGIGPIVTASIILQLMVGSKIINWNLQSKEGKAKFMGTQKILAILFCIFEAIAYVVAGAIPPAAPGLSIMSIVILQLALGGFLVMFMDEVVTKWGFGSGISLFIAGGVSKTMFIRLLAPPVAGLTEGGLIASFLSSLGLGQPLGAAIVMLPVISTLVVFTIVVFAQSMRIEIPVAFSLPFGKFASRRWPLKFIYTSNIPVILTAAVLANIQIVGRLLHGRGITFLGEFDASTGQAISGFMYYITPHSSMSMLVITVLGGVLALVSALAASSILKKWVFRITTLGAVVGMSIGYFLVSSSTTLPQITGIDIFSSIIYLLVMVIGSMIFSIFWVSTSGMDASSVAEQFRSSSIAIPGFRQDPRIVERVLQRYIPALSVMGGAFVGLLAGFADLTNALGTGTGILLTVMIVYQLYEQIAQQHMEDMHPALRKFMGGN